MPNRSLWEVIGLSIITLGLYSLYWIYVTRKEMAQKGASVPSYWLLLAPILLLLGIVMIQFFIDTFLGNGNGSGSPGDILVKILNIITVLVGTLAVLGTFPAIFYWFYKYCQAVESVTKGSMTLSSAYIIWILCFLFGLLIIWMAVMQSAFNKSKNEPERPVV